LAAPGRTAVRVRLRDQRDRARRHRAARETGDAIPPHWAIDADGRPTTDPHAALRGAMRTFGGHKGSALAAMVELLGGALIGDLTSQESLAFDGGVGATPCHGELVVAFDPKVFLGDDLDAGLARGERLFDAITAQGRDCRRSGASTPVRAASRTACGFRGRCTTRFSRWSSEAWRCGPAYTACPAPRPAAAHRRWNGQTRCPTTRSHGRRTPGGWDNCPVCPGRSSRGCSHGRERGLYSRASTLFRDISSAITMPTYRSKTSTAGRNMAGARSLWRATGMKDDDFSKPIIAVVNSFTQFVPGHVHLKDLGQLVAREIEAAGGVAKEFNTIAVDDGIAMGHDGMLYSLPSRDIIADSVEYMVNAHCADAMVCISNCDKITPGMLMAAMRLNIPVIFVSGGPMEAGKTRLANPVTKTIELKKLDLVDAMVIAADQSYSDADVAEVERSACPTCGSCSGMFTANSMNCLTEALGLSLPGNGTVVATHADREQLFKRAGRRIVELTRQYYEQDDVRVLPRSVGFNAFENAMTLDIAMGGSTNTILHLLAIARKPASTSR
jgi:hypothetical protein